VISLLVAYDEKGVIGKQNELPWYLPADLSRFKELTIGHPVVMGRKTFDSIVKRLGRALPDRTNVVLTRDAKFSFDDVTVVHDLDTALVMFQPEGEVFVIGGAQIFGQTINVADKIYATEVHADIDGDVFFPGFDKSQWQEISREEHGVDEKNNYDYAFVIYERLK
jgi:dihydrofolate reductase